MGCVGCVGCVWMFDECVWGCVGDDVVCEVCGDGVWMMWVMGWEMTTMSGDARLVFARTRDDWRCVWRCWFDGLMKRMIVVECDRRICEWMEVWWCMCVWWRKWWRRTTCDTRTWTRARGLCCGIVWCWNWWYGSKRSCGWCLSVNLWKFWGWWWRFGNRASRLIERWSCCSRWRRCYSKWRLELSWMCCINDEMM